MSCFAMCILYIILYIVLHMVCAATNKENPTNDDVEIQRRYVEDRFDKDLPDDEWHVAHVKFTELDGRRDCRGETINDKVRRYRKMLKNDGGRVKYVSAEPLPFDQSALDEDKCVLDKFDANVTTKSSKMPTTDIKTIDKTEATDAEPSDVTTTLAIKTAPAITTPNETAQVTPVSVKGTENSTKEKVRRSEYMFSSVEYYDEVVTFDGNICPDAVDEIILEIDQLRAYDVECEAIIEWRSLS